MGDGSGLAEAMLGLDGVRVTGVSEADGEVTIEIETTESRAWCRRCGCRAESQDRMWVDVRDLECFGRPTRLRVWKRRWRCREPLCTARTWTEPLEFLDAQVVLTRRTGAEASLRSKPPPVSDAGDCDEHGIGHGSPTYWPVIVVTRGRVRRRHRPGAPGSPGPVPRRADRAAPHSAESVPAVRLRRQLARGLRPVRRAAPTK